MSDYLAEELKKSSETRSKIDPKEIRKAADVILESLRNGGQVLFMGNGGSSADAQQQPSSSRIAVILRIMIIFSFIFSSRNGILVNKPIHIRRNCK